MAPTPAVPDHGLMLLGRAVHHLIAKSGFSVAFGGLMTTEGATLSTYEGTIGASIHGLTIEPREGLGGQAIQNRVPLCTVNYERAASITHRYQREVSAERIVTLVALPILVDGGVRGVIYGGHRTAAQPGTDTMRSATKAASDMGWELSVQDEVGRRMATMDLEWQQRGTMPTQSKASYQAVREQYAELREIANSITDPDTRRRLDDLGRALVGRLPSTIDRGGEALTRREIDTLALVALGLRNAQIARRLGLEESTVKAYLSSAMRKLGATGRFEAVLRARAGGTLP